MDLRRRPKSTAHYDYTVAEFKENILSLLPDLKAEISQILIVSDIYAKHNSIDRVPFNKEILAIKKAVNIYTAKINSL